MMSKFKKGETVSVFHAFASKPYRETVTITDITDWDMSGDVRGEPFIWWRNKAGMPCCAAETFVDHI